jgi:four helix bundle protein
MALSHHTPVAWQRADDLFIKVHMLCRSFPSLELYALSSQTRRAAYSVAANIVEGFGRRTRRDRLHFLHLAEASYPAHLTHPTYLPKSSCSSAFCVCSRFSA